VQAFVAGPAHAGIHLGEAVHDAQHLLSAAHLRLSGDFIDQFRAEVLRGGFRIGLLHQQRAEVLDEIAEQAGEVFSSLALLMNRAQGADGVAFQNMACEPRDSLASGEAKDVQHILLRDVCAAKGHELVQHGLRVTHAALRALADGKRGLFIELHVFQLGDVEEVLGDDGVRDAAQVKALTATDDRGEDLVRLRGGEDELHVRRRLFERLQQRIEGTGGEHVHLVDVVDFVRAARGSEFHVFTQFAHLLDAVVAGAVDLQHVHAASFGDFLAEFVLGIEIDAGAALGTERLGKDARGGGLAGATRADEEVGVREAVLRDGVAQRAHDVLLAQHVGEGLRSVFSGKNLVTHGGARLAGHESGARAEVGEKAPELAALGSREVIGT